MTTPTGLPAWTRTADFIQYGGAVDKANYQSQGVVNPRTDVGAEGFSRLVADTAAVVRTAEFATMQILCVDGGSNTPTVENCRLMTGATVISYVGSAPPAGFPAASRNGNGDVTITFASSYNDEYGVGGAFIAKEPIANLVGAGGGVAVPELLSATAVRVRALSLSNVAISGARFTLSIGSGT
jgi:hypothetical protein